MKLDITVTNTGEKGEIPKKSMEISDSVYGKDYSINELIDFIKKENPSQLVISVKEIFKGEDLKLFLETVKNSDIKTLKLLGDQWFEKEADFSVFLEVNVLDRILNPTLLGNRVNLNFMVKNEERVNKILKNEELAQVLKSYVPHCQTFSESCSAFSILNILCDKTDGDNYNIYNELSIYKDVWEKPGGIADPIKLVNFLKKNGYDIDLDEDKTLVNNMIEKVKTISPAEAVRLETKFSMLENTFDKKNIHVSPVNDSNFTSNTTLLLFTSFGNHVVYAKKQPNGMVDYCDPEYYEKKLFDTVEKFAKSTSQISGNTGIRFAVNKKVN